MNEPTSLQDLAEMAVERHGLSGRQLAFKAQQHGLQLTNTTFNAIRSNTYKFQASDETLRALAWLAGVHEDVAFTAAGKPKPGPPLADELPPGVDNLSLRSRRAAIEMLRALVAAEQGGGEHDQRSAPMTHAGHSPATDDLAARRRGHAGTPDDAVHPGEDNWTAPPPLEQLAADDSPSEGRERRRRLDESEGA